MRVVRSIAAVLLALALTPCQPLAAQGTLTIHQINVQQGDCTLIVGPDGTTFLIDAGNVGKGAGEVVPYLRSVGIQPVDGLDFMLATHRDSDHLGGLDEVIGAGYDVRETIWDNGSTKTGGQIGDFLDEALGTTAGAVQAMPLSHVVQLGGGATATCVSVHGEVINLGPISGATDENDLSVAILVRFGDFEYITGGDLGGGDDDFDCTGRSTGQSNVESRLARALLDTGMLGAGGVEVLDVNHHGSESSTNVEYMNLLSPTVAVINTGPGQGGSFHHPRADVVERVLMAQVDCVTVAPAMVLQTEEGSPIGANTSLAAFCVGDVVISTTGAGTFHVSATGEVSQGPDERSAAGILSGRAFPLDGGGAIPPPTGSLISTEIMMDPASVADTAGEWFEVLNPGTQDVDIDGWTISDDDSDSHRIDNGGPLLVPAGGRLVLGRNGDPNQNGGYLAGYVYSGINLANSADEIVLRDRQGEVVDHVAYGPSWPRSAGRSMALRDISLDNGDGSSWEMATTRGGTFSGGGTDFGTPGG
jgi:beta-lactamase superfamily II metal-dependent hydrolase